MAYLKVYTRTKSPAGHVHHAIIPFDPGEPSEADAYARGADMMRKFVGAQWAVSVVCYGPCAALPVVCDPRSRDLIAGKIKPRATTRELLQLVHARSYGGGRDGLIELAKGGMLLEVYPGEFKLSDAGLWAIGLDEPAKAA